MVRRQIANGEGPVADPFNIFMMEFTPEEKFRIAQLYSYHTHKNTISSLHAQGIEVPSFTY